MIDALNKLTGTEAKALVVFIVDKFFILLLVHLVLKHSLMPLVQIISGIGRFCGNTFFLIWRDFAGSGAISPDLGEFQSVKKSPKTPENS